MNSTIQQKIIKFLTPVSKELFAADVRIGLGYTSVRLDNGNTGIAWTALSEGTGCTHMHKAGTLAGRPAGELIQMLAPHNELMSNKNLLSGSIGLAAANAVAVGIPRVETTRTDVLELVEIKEGDHVAMVGFFGPLIPQIKQTGCRLDIVELKTDRPGTLTPGEGQKALSRCSIAIITATSIVNGTLDELLSYLSDPRAVVLLGPSSFMRPEVFKATPVTHIAGVRIRDARAVERIISEGGGTMILKPYMDFETIRV